MFGIEKDFQNLMEQVYGPLNKDKMTEIEKTKAEIKMLEKKLSFLEELEKTKSPVEEAYKRVYGNYPMTDDTDGDWENFQAGYKSAQKDYKVGEWEPTPQTPEQTTQSLKEAFREAQQTENWKELQKKIDAPAEGIYDNIDVNKLLEKWEKNPPEFLKFELGQTLYDVCMTWWGRVFDNNDDMETCIDDLVDNIDYWLPKSQSAAGSQSLGVEDMVEGFNDCLKKIKRKLR